MGHVCDVCYTLFISYSFLHFSFLAFHWLATINAHLARRNSRVSSSGAWVPNRQDLYGPNKQKHGCSRRSHTSSFSRLGTTLRHRVPILTTARSLVYACLVSVGTRPMSGILSNSAASIKARDKADRVTPLGLTAERRMDELTLFTALSALQASDSLHR